MSLYSVRSERAFCEELEYHLLFRWFLDMDMVEASFDHSTFSKNRERLLLHRVRREFFDEVVRQASRLDLLSDDHFSVDGTLIEAAASLTSFRPKDEPPPADRPDGGNPNNRWVDFHGEKRTNATHQSRTDPDARLCRKGPGKEAKLSYMGQALMENRHGLLKTVGAFRKTRFRGLERVDFAGYLVATAYNLVRLVRLAPVRSLG